MGDAEGAEVGDEVGGDGDLEFAGEELDAVVGLRVEEEHGEGLGSFVFLDDGDEAVAEVVAQHGGGEVEGEAVEEIVGDVAEKAYFLDLEGVGRGLALGTFFGLEEVFLPDFAFDVEGFVGLHVAHESFMVFAEESEFVAAAVVFDDGLGPGTACLGGHLGEGGDDARDGDFGRLFGGLTFVDEVGEACHLTGGEGLDLEVVTVERMGGEVHADEVLFVLEEAQDIFFTGHFGHFRPFGPHLFHLSEKGGGGVCLVVAEEFGVADNFVYEEIAVFAGKGVL